MIWSKYDPHRYSLRPSSVDCPDCAGLSDDEANCEGCADTGLRPIPLAEVMYGLERQWEKRREL